MNRELKFRAWGRINKHMYPVAFPSWNGTVEGKIDLVSHEVEEIEQDGDDTPVLMQSTGLFDRNGTEIYEGDLLSAEKNCLYDQGRHVTSVIFKDGGFTVSTGSCVPLSIITEGFKPEVIGNVFQHPHLLERP